MISKPGERHNLLGLARGCDCLAAGADKPMQNLHMGYVHWCLVGE
jgi:hypothetical protein